MVFKMPACPFAGVPFPSTVHPRSLQDSNMTPVRIVMKLEFIKMTVVWQEKPAVLVDSVYHSIVFTNIVRYLTFMFGTRDHDVIQ